MTLVLLILWSALRERESLIRGLQGSAISRHSFPGERGQLGDEGVGPLDSPRDINKHLSQTSLPSSLLQAGRLFPTGTVILSWSLPGSQSWGEIQLVLPPPLQPCGSWWLMMGTWVTPRDSPKAFPAGRAYRLITAETHFLEHICLSLGPTASTSQS